MRNCCLLVILSVCYISSAQAASTCTFAKWDSYGSTTLLRESATGAYLFSTTEVKVDADGAPNAYHPDDVGLHCTRGTGFKGLDCPANAGYPKSSWWPSVIVPDPHNPSKGYVQPDGAYKGFFVSRTSLQDGTKKDRDISKYVNAAIVPYFVLPGSFYKRKGTGSLGDFGYALNLENGKASPFVIAEVGPSNARLGEMSIALAVALGGINPDPRTGAGSPTGKVLFVVFPKSRNVPAWPLSQEQIKARSDALLESVGGEEMLRECGNGL